MIHISDLFLDDCGYDDYFVLPLESNKNVPSMPPLESHEEEV